VWPIGCHPDFISDAKHVVLIHGTWCRGDSWDPTSAAFEERGYTVHTPTLRHHELPLQEGAMKIVPLSMRDYTDDLVALVDSLDSPPLIVGLSLGGLPAQLAARAYPSCRSRRRLPGTCARVRTVIVADAGYHEV
jgi:pimeloyl-ACP methyl ester carboxylesterase